MAQCLRISLLPSCKTCVLMLAYRRDLLEANFTKRTMYKKERPSSQLNTSVKIELFIPTCPRLQMKIKPDSLNMSSRLVT